MSVGQAGRFAVPPTLDPAALADPPFGRPLTDLAGTTMGTGWRVRLATPAGFDTAALHRAIVRLLDGLVGEMSHWLPGSALMAFNTAPAGSWHALPPHFAAVTAAALEVAAASGGAFDPAIGRLADAWGLGPNRAAAPPGDAALAEALHASGWHRLAFDGAAGRLRQPGGLWLDLSGIAKGYAADAVARLVRQSGARHMLAEVGGEIVGCGMRPDGDPWWVELEAPPGSGVAPLRAALHALAAATSGSYVRGAHTLVPRTGRPIAHDTVAVSVLHPSAMLADAWATALTVMAPDLALEVAGERRLAMRLVRSDGSERISPALAEMLA